MIHLSHLSSASMRDSPPFIEFWKVYEARFFFDDRLVKSETQAKLGNTSVSSRISLKIEILGGKIANIRRALWRGFYAEPDTLPEAAESHSLLRAWASLGVLIQIGVVVVGREVGSTLYRWCRAYNKGVKLKCSFVIIHQSSVVNVSSNSASV